MRKNLKNKVLLNIECDKEKGLTLDQVQYQIQNKRINQTEDNNGKSYGAIIFSNIFTFFNMLMIIIAGLQILFCGINIISNMSYLMLLFVNTLIGTIQECKSKKTLTKLKLLNSSKVTVIRDGNELEIYPQDIVQKDLLKLKSGDQIPADLQITKINNAKTIEVNESLLTGESHAVKKSINDELLAGSYIISGVVYAIAEKVGCNTYLHSIEEKARGFKKPKSKLLLSIHRIIKILACIAIPLSLISFWTELVRVAHEGVANKIYFIWDELEGVNLEEFSFFYDPVKWLTLTITYMIPAGMILLSSVAMATGVINLGRKKALTKDLYSVEALSRVDTLCLDKTGTITDGTMEVIDDCNINTKYTNDEINQIVASYLSAFENENQTSIAMIKKYGKKEFHKIINKIEFSSDRKYSAVEFEDIGCFALGAPEYLTKDPHILEQSKEYASKGMRVILMISCKGHIKDEIIPDKRENFMLFFIQDHIRPEVPKTMKWFRENDVDIRVISGDNITTVSYIAKQAGIEDYDKCVDMSTIKKDENYVQVILENKIFGRVSPEQKAEIVDILKKNGRTVSMTGDGINDIVSLKKADCSIALSNGAPATKSIANIVLLDSNFENMKNAVLEGRRVVNNVQRSSILFIMKDFLWMFIAILPIILGIQRSIEPTVMTMVNTMITGIASTLLAFEPDKERIKGNFLQTVLTRSIIAAFFMFIPIVASYIFAFCHEGLTGDVSEYMKTLMPVMTLGVIVAGFIIFYNICTPFTKYRKWLFGIITVVSAIMLIFAPNMFLINGTEFLANLREYYNNNIIDIIHYFLNTIFIPFKMYREATEPFNYYIRVPAGAWIMIGVFIAISWPTYLFIDKHLTKFVDRILFKRGNLN